MKLSVIVPSLDGRVPQGLRDQVAVCADAELVVVTGVSPVGRARNEGLRRATGEYVAWVDADDEVTADWLAEILAACADSPDVVTIDAELVGWKGRRECVWGVGDREASAARLLRDVCRDIRRPSWLCLYVMRRDLWENLAFDETVRVAEDYLVLPKALLGAQSCRYVAKRLYRYVRAEASVSNTQTAAQRAAQIGLWERRVAECPSAYRASCRWGLSVSAYWVCRAFALKEGGEIRENARRCRRLIGRAYPHLLREALFGTSLAARDRLGWMARFTTAALDLWTIQRRRAVI